MSGRCASSSLLSVKGLGLGEEINQNTNLSKFVNCPRDLLSTAGPGVDTAENRPCENVDLVVKL
jgi:hypothetical protein